MEKFRVGFDPWIRCCKNFRLPPELVAILNRQGIKFLNQIVEEEWTTFWSQAWKSAEKLNLHGKFSGIWNNYIRSLKRPHVRIRDRNDSLLRVHSPSRTYTQKSGYSFHITSQLRINPSWWWKNIWKLTWLDNSRFFVSCLINNKVTNWDNLIKRHKEGPR